MDARNINPDVYANNRNAAGSKSNLPAYAQHSSAFLDKNPQIKATLNVKPKQTEDDAILFEIVKLKRTGLTNAQIIKKFKLSKRAFEILQDKAKQRGMLK